VRLLRKMGYANARYYRGGIENWTTHGLALEGTSQVVTPADGPRANHAAPRLGRADRLADMLNDLPVRRVFEIWLGVILMFGLLYWIEGSLGAMALRVGDHASGPGWRGLGEALYFSFVTALSIGYGDVVPSGLTRVLAIVEGTGGLLLFGVLVSKLVSRRQEAITADIHRIAFEDRLGRVRTNLHLVLTELQAITNAAREGAVNDSIKRRFVSRLESAAAVLAGELTVVHDLLYRPERTPGEDLLEAILANLFAVLEELAELLDRIPDEKRSNSFRSNLRAVSRLADDICGECVPRSYAPDLKEWMDRIRERAQRIG